MHYGFYRITPTAMDKTVVDQSTPKIIVFLNSLIINPFFINLEMHLALIETLLMVNKQKQYSSVSC